LKGHYYYLRDLKRRIKPDMPRSHAINYFHGVALANMNNGKRINTKYDLQNVLKQK
jgi:hypothetical protein